MRWLTGRLAYGVKSKKVKGKRGFRGLKLAPPM